jgi:hypothetical protein
MKSGTVHCMALCTRHKHGTMLPRQRTDPISCQYIKTIPFIVTSSATITLSGQFSKPKDIGKYESCKYTNKSHVSTFNGFFCKPSTNTGEEVWRYFFLFWIRTFLKIRWVTQEQADGRIYYQGNSKLIRTGVIEGHRGSDDGDSFAYDQTLYIGDDLFHPRGVYYTVLLLWWLSVKTTCYLLFYEVHKASLFT